MGLTQSQRCIWEKAKSLGSGGQAVEMTDSVCSYILSIIVRDLGHQAAFPELPEQVQPFFDPGSFRARVVPGVDALRLYERLVGVDPDADTYFACLAALHRARLKYERILETQPIPTIEQVGPRGLLQFGKLSARSLAALMFWRKWFYDIDNRAGQETGYLFEPIIANAIGGTPVPSSRSPVKRHQDKSKGRQVDCLRDKKAYELKIRVTIAASGKGRWHEELAFPVDCEESGFTPVLLVWDGTPNPKLTELARAFRERNGEVYVGRDAWQHLDDLAGSTMSRFIEIYVRKPIESLLADAPERLPPLSARIGDDGSMVIEIDSEVLRIARCSESVATGSGDEIPTNAGDQIPGP